MPKRRLLNHPTPLAETVNNKPTILPLQSTLADMNSHVSNPTSRKKGSHRLRRIQDGAAPNPLPQPAPVTDAKPIPPPKPAAGNELPTEELNQEQSHLARHTSATCHDPPHNYSYSDQSANSTVYNTSDRDLVGPSQREGSGTLLSRFWRMITAGTDINQLRQNFEKLHNQDRRELDEAIQELGQVRQELGQIRQELGQGHQELVHAHQELGEARHEIEQMHKVKSQLEAENTKHQELVRKFALQIDSLNQELFHGQQMSDKDVRSKYRALFTQVKQWSVSFASDHGVDKAKWLANDIFPTIAPKDRLLQLLDKKTTRKLCVQALVGHILAECVFRRLAENTDELRGFDAWSQGHAEDISNIERSLYDAGSVVSARELNDWRAFTVALVSRAEAQSGNTVAQGTVSNNAAHEYATSILDLITPLVKKTEKNRESEILNKLVAIFQMAIDMCLVLRKQRACWIIRSEYGLFDATRMEDPEDDYDSEGDVDRHRDVALYIFPGLYKQGNADGENYEIECCLEKARVKCIQRAGNQM